MRISKTIFPVASAICIAIGVLFVLYHTDDFVNQSTDSDLELKIDPITNNGDLPAVKVVGRTNQPCWVTLELNGFPYARKESRGTFEFANVILRPGENNVIASCTRNLFTQSAARDEKHPFLQVPPLASPPYEDANRDILTWDKPIITPVARTVNATFSYRKLKMEFTAVLEASDKRLNLIGDNLLSPPKAERAPQFIKQVFNDLKVGKFKVAGWCENEIPVERGTTGKATVIVSCVAPQSIFQNTFDQNFAIDTDWRSIANEDDTVILTVRDYSLQRPILDDGSFLQVYDSSSATIIKAPARGASPSRVRVFLTYDMFAPANIAGALRSSLQNFIPPNLLAVYVFLAGALFAIPMVWVFATIENRADVSLLDPDTAVTFKRITPWLVAILLIPFLYYLLNNIASHELPRQLVAWVRRGTTEEFNSEDLRLLVFLAAALTVTFFLLFAVVRVFRSSVVSAWLRAFCSALGFAALIVLVTIIFAALQLKLIPWLNPSPVVSTAIVWLGLVGLIILARKLMITLSSKKSMLNVIAGVSIAALLVVAIARLSTESRPMYSGANRAMEVLDNIGTAANLLWRLLPYIVLLAVLVLLKRSSELETADDHKSETVVALGMIFFAGYVVTPGAEWLMIPLPLLLAIWLFRKYLLFSKERRELLNLNSAFVVEQRPQWAAKVRSAIEANLLKDTFKQIEKQKATLSEEELKKRKAAAEVALKQHEANLKFDQGFTLKDVLLGVGPYASDWQNGLSAIKRGLVLAIPLFLIDISKYEAISFFKPNDYLMLAFMARVITPICYWLSAAFFFGYFFSIIRGHCGLKKGLWLSLLLIVCLSVSDLGLRDQLQRSAEILYFFPTLGLLFDRHNFRDSMRDEFRWKQLLQYQTGWTPEISGAAIALWVVSTIGSTIFKFGLDTALKQLAKNKYG